MSQVLFFFGLFFFLCLLGNNHFGNIFAEVITIKTLFAVAKPSAKKPTDEVNIEGCSQLTFTYSNLTIETVEKDVKYVQN